jgi:ADP-ribose pyrophosphatase
MTYQITNSDQIYKGKVFDVRIDQVRTPSGGNMQVDVVEHIGAVVILPIDTDSRIWFVRQYRHATGKKLLELPAGTLEEGEEPRACAIRETREEVGMAPGQINDLGGFFLAPGYSTEYLHIFTARDLTHAPLHPDKDEEFVIERLSLEQIHEYIHLGQIEDAKTLASLYLYSLHGDS